MTREQAIERLRQFIIRRGRSFVERRRAEEALKVLEENNE